MSSCVECEDAPTILPLTKITPRSSVLYERTAQSPAGTGPSGRGVGVEVVNAACGVGVPGRGVSVGSGAGVPGRGVGVGSGNGVAVGMLNSSILASTSTSLACTSL